MKKEKFVMYLLNALLIAGVIACSDDDNLPPEQPGQGGETEIPVPPEDEDDEYVDPGDDPLVPNSQTVSLDNMVSISFASGEASIENPFDGKGVTISQENGHVIIRSEITDKELNYVLSGIIANGSVKIYGEYKFGLILNGTGITNPKGAAINIQCGKKNHSNPCG